MMEDFWKQLHWYNIPELESKPSSFDDNQVLLRMLLAVDYNIYEKGKPTFLYLYNNTIPELDSISHSENAIIKLNNLGLDFYLYEPLFLRTITQDTHFDNVISCDDKDLRSEELDSILAYIKRNQLTDVTVYVGDYDIDNYLSYYSDHMKFVVKDLHILTVDPIEITDQSISASFTRKFINLNGRYSTYRHIIASYLSDKSTYSSWNHDTILPLQTEWYDLSTWDIEIEPVIAHSTVDNFAGLESYYRDSFCDIVSESRFHRPLGNFSEKTLKPLYYKKPFILIAPPKTLEYMKTLGFQTFNEFWDESYDKIEDHEKRFKKVLTLIDFIDTMSLSELRTMYLKMVPILEHNFQIVNQLVFPYLYEYARRKGLLAN